MTVDCRQSTEPITFLYDQFTDPAGYTAGLPDMDAALSDSLVEEITPILLSPPESRQLEEWYGINENWVDRFGDRESVLIWANLAFKKFQQQQDLASAALVKNAISRIHTKNGDYTESVEAQHQALEMAREIEIRSSLAGV